MYTVRTFESNRRASIVLFKKWFIPIIAVTVSFSFTMLRENLSLRLPLPNLPNSFTITGFIQYLTDFLHISAFRRLNESRTGKMDRMLFAKTLVCTALVYTSSLYS